MPHHACSFRLQKVLMIRPSRALLSLVVTALLVAGCSNDSASNAPVAAPVDPDAAPDATATPDPATAAGPAAEPLYRELRDVLVACDNGRHCEVIGVADDARFGLTLRLSRDPGTDGAQQVRLGTYDGRMNAATLQLDGQASAPLRALPWRSDADTGALVLDDPAAIAAFIALVRNGARLSSGAGQARTDVSLSGLAAALLLVDEHQQRLDTPGAWARTGERDAAAVPSAPSLPRLPPAPAPQPSLTGEEVRTFADGVRERQADALRARDCDAPRDAYDIRRHDDAHPLDADHVLVFVACYSGAYQTASLPFRVARAGDAAEPLALPSPPGLEGVIAARDFTMLTNAGYVPATGTLSHLAKGRGLGDCGEAATWRYDGTAFHLASYAALRRCGGAAPGEWPSLWRTAD